MLKQIKSEQSGFTLVELMVVVAIIGVLTSVAIPQYNKYVSRARQTEAKVNLGALLTSEKAFVIENNSYTGCATSIAGIQAPGGTAYYGIGFLLATAQAVVAAPNGCGAAGGISCDRTSYPAGALCAATTSNALTWAAGFPVASSTAASNIADISNANHGMLINRAAFTAGASGGISNIGGVVATWDRWSITQDGVMTNNQLGL